MYNKRVIFSCDLLSLYTAEDFLRVWLSGIITIMNNNSNSASIIIIIMKIGYIIDFDIDIFFNFKVKQTSIWILKDNNLFLLKQTKSNINTSG